MEKESKYNPVQYIAINKIVEGLIKDYMVETEYKDDLTQEVYLILLTHNQKMLQKIIEKNQIRFYIARIIRNQYFSNTSAFYRKYKKPKLNKETLKPILDMEEGNDDDNNYD
ncbi:MAG: hypothetical protein IJH39_04135 [Clostridia bacterium]|nr:hypothetical protein [Clostridia bacterium]